MRKFYIPLIKRFKQDGFSLITALFILVILAAVSGFSVSIAGMIHSTTSLVQQGEVAFFAARSGLEWGLFKVSNNPAACPATTTLTLSQGVLDNFTVQVTCSAASVTEGSATFNIFTLNSLAERGSFGNGDYISREMQVTTTLGN